MSGWVNESVVVLEKQFDCFPKSFYWRGSVHDVLRIERCRRSARRKLLGKAERRVFCVRTADARYNLVQDLSSNEWRLTSAMDKGA